MKIPTECQLLRNSARLTMAAFLFGLSSASAQITLDFNWDGVDTLVTWSVTAGSTLSGSSAATGIPGQPDMMSENAFLAVNEATIDVYTAASVTTPWDLYDDDEESSISVSASGRTGSDVFGFSGGSFFVANGYDLATGPALSGTMTYSGKSLTDLGFSSNTSMAGSFAAAGTTANWTTSAVPEPATYGAMLGLAALSLVFLRRRGGSRVSVG